MATFATVKAHQRFPEITERIEAVVKVALREAADEAERVAQAEASIDLRIDERGPIGTQSGYSAGIKSLRTSDVPGRSTPLAHIFNDGTLGKRSRRLGAKSRRRNQWTVRRGGTTYVAHRGDVTGEGIPGEGFFRKARAAGKKVLLARIDRGI